MAKWISIGGIWYTEKGGLSIQLDKTMLPDGDDQNKIRLSAFKNERKEAGSKQPDYRIMRKEEENVPF